MNEEKRTSSRKTRVGRVVSDKMDKTVVVAIDDRVAHPLYKKIVEPHLQAEGPRRGERVRHRRHASKSWRPAPCPRTSGGAWSRSSKKRSKEVPL